MSWWLSCGREQGTATGVGQATAHPTHHVTSAMRVAVQCGFPTDAAYTAGHGVQANAASVWPAPPGRRSLMIAACTAYAQLPTETCRTPLRILDW